MNLERMFFAAFWRKRIGGLHVSAILGFSLLLGSCYLFGKFELESATKRKTYEEGMAKVFPLERAEIDYKYNGSLVHFVDTARSTRVLTDPYFDLTTDGLKLRRLVEMCQWQEQTATQDNEPSYQKIWSQQYIGSNNFKLKEAHINPPDFGLGPQIFQSSDIRVGQFEIPRWAKKQMHRYEYLKLSPTLATKLPNAKLLNDGTKDLIYVGRGNIEAPMVGDLKIYFDVIPTQQVSVLAQQSNQTVLPYNSRAGRQISMVRFGEVSSAQMLETLIDEEQNLRTLRALWFIFLFFGLVLILRPIFGSYIKSMLEVTGLLCAAFVGSFVLLFFTIVIIWVLSPPAVGSMLAAMLLLGFTSVTLREIKNLPSIKIKTSVKRPI